MQVISEEAKKDILDRVEQKASSYQYEFKGCAQAILLALQQEFDLPGNTAVIKASSFAGRGIARLGSLCGCLFAGMMALGLASGREYVEEDIIYPEPKVIDKDTGLPKSLTLIRSFYERFVEEYGATCHEIQIKLFGRSYDMGDPRENDEFSEVSDAKCSEIVGKAARLAAETILEMPRR